jgi:hypothetical protein
MRQSSDGSWRRALYALNAANYGPLFANRGQHDRVPAGGFVIRF